MATTSEEPQPLGAVTIRELGLKRRSLEDAYSRFVRYELDPQISDLLEAGADVPQRWSLVCRRLQARAPFTALTVDVLTHKLPAEFRTQHDLDPRRELEKRLA